MEIERKLMWRVDEAWGLHLEQHEVTSASKRYCAIEPEYDLDTLVELWKIEKYFGDTPKEAWEKYIDHRQEMVDHHKQELAQIGENIEIARAETAELEGADG